MIYKHPYGVSPSLSVTIDGASVAYDTIKEVEILLEENLHDMAIISLISLPTRASAAYRGRPVQITLDTGGTYFHEFVGYVAEVAPQTVTHSGTTNGSPFQDAKLVCLGSSYKMRGATSKVWGDMRLDEVAVDLASKYGFSIDVPYDKLVFAPMIQSGESDWQFLVKYCKMMGYSVTLHGTHLHVFDPYKAASRSSSFNKLRSPREVSATIAPHPGNIAALTASLTDAHPDGVYKDTIVTVHTDGVDVFDVSLRELRGLSSPALFPDRLSDAVDSYDQAVRAIQEHSKEHYDLTAEVECLGIAGCVPGGVVKVDEYGGEVDGLWYVRSVSHKLNSGIFVSNLSLGRNHNSELLTSSPVSSFMPPPPPALVKDTWVASRRTHLVYT